MSEQNKRLEEATPPPMPETKPAKGETVEVTTESLDRLTQAIRELVEVNQAMLEYIVNGVLAGDEAAPVGQSLDDA